MVFCRRETTVFAAAEIRLRIRNAVNIEMFRAKRTLQWFKFKSAFLKSCEVTERVCWSTRNGLWQISVRWLEPGVSLWGWSIDWMWAFCLKTLFEQCESLIIRVAVRWFVRQSCAHSDQHTSLQTHRESHQRISVVLVIRTFSGSKRERERESSSRNQPYLSVFIQIVYELVMFRKVCFLAIPRNGANGIKQLVQCRNLSSTSALNAKVSPDAVGQLQSLLEV